MWYTNRSQDFVLVMICCQVAIHLLGCIMLFIFNETPAQIITDGPSPKRSLSRIRLFTLSVTLNIYSPVNNYWPRQKTRDVRRKGYYWQKWDACDLRCRVNLFFKSRLNQGYINNAIYYLQQKAKQTFSLVSGKMAVKHLSNLGRIMLLVFTALPAFYSSKL